MKVILALTPKTPSKRLVDGNLTTPRYNTQRRLEQAQKALESYHKKLP